MPAPQPLPREVCEAWAQLQSRSDLTKIQCVSLVRKEWPEHFAPNVTDEAVMKRCRQYCTKHGIELQPKVPHVPKPKLRYLEEVPELVFPYRDRLAVCSDAHFSAHDTEIVSRFLEVLDTEQIHTVVMNGDQMDNSYLGHKGMRSRWAAPFDEDLDMFQRFCNMVTDTGVSEIIVLQGNHDDKPLRGTDHELTYAEWFDAKVSPHLDKPTLYRVTHRYYAIMKPEIQAPWPFPDGHRNFPWRFTHQREYSRLPLSVAKRIATKYTSNVCCGHMHHLSQGWHESRRFKVCDAGTMQHRDGAAYKVNRDSTHPEWNPGFLTLIDNEVRCHEVV